MPGYPSGATRKKKPLWHYFLTKMTQWFQLLLIPLKNKWKKVFKNGPSKICGRQPLKDLKWYEVKSFKQTIPLQFFKGCLPQILLGQTWNWGSLRISAQETQTYIYNKRKVHLKSKMNIRKQCMKFIQS